MLMLNIFACIILLPYQIRGFHHHAIKFRYNSKSINNIATTKTTKIEKFSSLLSSSLSRSSSIVSLSSSSTSTGASTSSVSGSGSVGSDSSSANNKSVRSSNNAASNKNLLYELIGGDIPWNTLVGQADRALRLGLQLEKSGLARASSAALHEAVTLYSCFLEKSREFSHVTMIKNEDDLRTLLAYVCARLAFLNLDALGDSKAAVRLYKKAAMIDPCPSSVSFDGLGKALEASGGGANLLEALDAYAQSQRLNQLTCGEPSKYVMFRMAVVLDRLEKIDESNELFDIIRRSEFNIACLNDSWGYVRWHSRKIEPSQLNVQYGTRDMVKLALDAASDNIIKYGGLVCEFGVGSGRSIRMTQELLPLNIPIHGFDTFTGLPQAWGNEPKGTYSTGGVVPKMDYGNVFFHQGLFSETIKPFLENQQQQRGSDNNIFLAYANIDCDLYSSTLDILEGMHGKIVPGTILLFDEYICHPTWRQDEFRAWRECCKRFGWKYEYLGFSLNTKQAVVRVLEA